MVDIYNFIDIFNTENFVAFAGRLFGAVNYLRQFFGKNIVDQGTFTAAGNSGNADKFAKWNLDIDVLQIVLPRAFNHQRCTIAFASFRGHWNLFRAAQVLPGERLFAVHDILHRTGGNHPAAVLAGTRPHVDNIIGGAHHALVMFDHQYSVADVPKPFQRLDQPVAVGQMQTHGRFIADIENTH